MSSTVSAGTRRYAPLSGRYRQFLRVTSSHDVWSVILLVNGVYWLATAGVEVLTYWGASGTTYEGVYLISPAGRLLNYFCDFLISSGAYRMLLMQTWPDNALGRVRVILVHLLLAIVCVWLFAVVLQLTGMVVDRQWQEWDSIKQMIELRTNLLDWAWSIRTIFPRYALGLTLIAFVRLSRRYHEESLHLATVSADFAQTRLSMLSAQLQPHFLFNSLNVITELVAQSPDRATQMLTRLGDFLRHALESSKQPWVNVQTEVSALEAYLAVQQARFGDQLQLHISVAPEAGSLIIPSLLLQPLVENAVEHGRAGLEATLHVRIGCQVTGGQLRVSISNSFPSTAAILAPSSYGYGLQNVQLRLRAAYGDSASLTIGPDPDHGTLAQITMPAMTTPPAQRAQP
jgi:sensor histidine kinase YesM